MKSRRTWKLPRTSTPDGTTKMPGNCRILIEFESKAIRVYYCNRAGRILDEEAFLIQGEDTPEESFERASIIHALIYDSLNYGINGRSSSKPEKRTE